MSPKFIRPGGSDDFLASAGCHHVGGDECVNLYGCRAEGIAIPFRSLDGQPIVDNKKPFARIRLYDGTQSQKYHQRGGSGTHIYIPHNFRTQARGATLVLTEGEFKALSLAEDGFAAIGLPGISGAMRNVDGEPKLHNELVEVMEFYKPVRVLFLGDSDTVFNSDFSREAAKLHKVLFDSKRFSFIQELRVAVCPLDGPKGADDVRGAMGTEFHAWFEALTENAFIVPAKATPAEIFCALLRRESEAVRTSIKGDGHDAHRNRVRLLQSAGKLQHETGAMLLLKPLLAGLLDVKETALAKMIKDAGQPAIVDNHIPATSEKGRVTLRNVEPWDKLVDGDVLLAEIAAFYEKFCCLPACTADVLAVWSLQTWCYELFDFAAIVAVWSPEHECGKGRVLDVTEKLVRRPFRTSNTSAAVLYHVISKGNLCVLVDELDSVSDEQRAAICNILKGGYQSNGTAHRMTERNGEQVEIEFSTFCPKMIATITLDKLDKATRSRTIGIRMQRNYHLTPDESERLRFWVLVANAKGRYSRGSSETLLDQDLTTLKQKGGAPELIDRLRQQVGRLDVSPQELEGRNQRSALFKTMFLAFRAAGAKDWRSNLAIAHDHSGSQHKLQFHHIFPKAVLKSTYPSREADDISNLAFIGGKTNRAISDKAPAAYFPALIEKAGVATFDAQCIPTEAALLELGSYKAFLTKRRELIANRLNQFLGTIPPAPSAP